MISIFHFLQLSNIPLYICIKSHNTFHFLLQCSDPVKLYNYCYDMTLLKIHSQVICMELPIEVYHNRTMAYLLKTLL